MPERTGTYVLNGLVKNLIPDSLVPTRRLLILIETQQIMAVDSSRSLGLRCGRMILKNGNFSPRLALKKTLLEEYLLYDVG